jgi:hypothetical protein
MAMSESPGPAWMDSANGRRWLISAAVVLLLHAGVAVAVLTWLKMTSTGPVLINLSPEPSASEQNATQAAPASEQTQPPAPEQNKTASTPAEQNATNSATEATPEQPRQESKEIPRDEAVAKSEPSAGTAVAPRDMTAPELPSSPQGTEAPSGTEGATISGGGISRAPAEGGIGGGAVATNPAGGGVASPGPVASAPASRGLTPGSPMTKMPLDTSITVQPPVHGNSGVGPFAKGEVGPLASREAGPPDQRPTSIFRPSKPFGVPDVPRNSLAPNGNLSLPGVGLKNLPGARVQDRARAATAREMSGAAPIKNAIGAAAGTIGTSTAIVASRGDTSAPGVGDGVARNAIGVTANFRPRIPRANAGVPQPGTLAATSRAMPPVPSINGRGFARPTTGPAMIGGPARTGAGALNGSDFHLRH